MFSTASEGRRTLGDTRLPVGADTLMVLTHLSLITLGALFITVPIILHLLMRRKPKHAIFPALRFVQQRRIASQRRMNVRHWLLLLLRCLAIAALAAALAGPRISAGEASRWVPVGSTLLLALLAGGLAIAAWARDGSGKLTWTLSATAGLLLLISGWLVAGTVTSTQNGRPAGEEAPVAAAMIIDSSPRMDYRRNNTTRLAEAKEFGLWLLGQLPRDSEVAVFDARIGGTAYPTDVKTAQKSIDGLETSLVSRPLSDILLDALALVSDSEKPQREVYVLSDLTDPSWSVEDPQRLRQLRAEHEEIPIYVIDVGAERPHNFAVRDLRLTSEMLSQNGTLELDAEIASEGGNGERTVDVLVEEPSDEAPLIVDGQSQIPPMTRRAREEIRLSDDESQWVRFSVGGLKPGTHHGQIQIASRDGLTVDDTRYFTVKVTPPWPVLVIPSESATPEFLTEALAPLEFRASDRARFTCQVAGPQELDTLQLEDFAIVCLLDPAPLPPRLWLQLEEFVQGGGGLAIFLGRSAYPLDQFNHEAAERVLPALLVRQYQSGPQPFYVALREAADQPLLREMRPWLDAISWSDFPVYRHWDTQPPLAGAVVVASYNNGKPAILERSLGAGHVLMMTTPISEPLNVTHRGTWNELLTTFDAWPTFALLNEMFLDLASNTATNLNHMVGQPVTMQLGAAKANRSGYQVLTPAGAWQQVAVEGNQLTVPWTTAIGAYRLQAADGELPANGFSVNVVPGSTTLARIDPTVLDDLLGSGKYRLTRDRPQFEREIGEARSGRELLPWLLLMLVVMLALEQLLANRFYQSNFRTPLKPGVVRART